MAPTHALHPASTPTVPTDVAQEESDQLPLDLTDAQVLREEAPTPEEIALSGGTPQTSDLDEVHRRLGRLVMAWGGLEHATAEKLSALRLAAGDVRLVGARTRPGMARLLAELRALVAMRDRHEKQALIDIADIENSLQRLAQFHHIVIDGIQTAEGGTLVCRDDKNGQHRISLSDIDREIAAIEDIQARLANI